MTAGLSGKDTDRWIIATADKPTEVEIAITTTILSSLKTVATPMGHPPVMVIPSSTRVPAQSRNLSKIIRKKGILREDMILAEMTLTLLITKLMRSD